MDTLTLKHILLEEMEKYTGEGYNDVAYLTTNETAQLYAVIDAARIRRKRIVGAVLIARIEARQIVIELDLHDKTLAEALKARGVPDEQVRLAYQDDVPMVS